MVGHGSCSLQAREGKACIFDQFNFNLDLHRTFNSRATNLSVALCGMDIAEDADFALETTNLAKNQILQQASTAMLAQANASKQNVLSLLQG